jgi:D-hexose-6-phosphate mutarotase
MIDIKLLQSQFSIPGVVSIEPGQGGLTRISVTSDLAEAHIYLHGAHVTHYKPRGSEDVLFLSSKSLYQPGKAIRGGVPVIFPWFGPKANDPAAPAHGTARTVEWELKEVRTTSDGTVVVMMETASTAATLALWPHPFLLRYTVTVGSHLEMALDVGNLSPSPFLFEEALHTYVAVKDVKGISIEGLDGREYLDKTTGMDRKMQPVIPITIVGETDRVYLGTPDAVTVVDPGLGRKLIVEKEGSASTVVWNPWIAKAKAMADFGDDEWPGMMCIETANATENAVELPAGGSHRMVAKIRTTGM